MQRSETAPRLPKSDIFLRGVFGMVALGLRQKENDTIRPIFFFSPWTSVLGWGKRKLHDSIMPP